MVWKSSWRDEYERKQAEEQAAAAAGGAAAEAGGGDAAATDGAAAAAAPGSAEGGEGAAAAPSGGLLGPDVVVRVGDRVDLVDGAKGTVRFKGPVFLLKKGTWYGVELEEPAGKNNGDHKGEPRNRAGPGTAPAFPCL